MRPSAPDFASRPSSPAAVALASAIAAALLPMGAAARQDCPEIEWSVVGLRASDEAPIREEVEGLRVALREALEERVEQGVRSEAAIVSRLGIGPQGLSFVEAQIEAAELFYFQFEFASAAESLQKAIDALAVRFEPRATNRARAAHFLLGAVHFGMGGADAPALAREALDLLAKVAPKHPPDPRAYPPEVGELFDELVAVAAAQKKGSLRVRREDGGGGQVWVGAHPIGAVGSEIPLPPGRYRVLITDALHRPSLHSLLHEVEIRSGEESSLWLDLGWEAAADSQGGPSFPWVGARSRPVVASRIAAKLGPDPLVLLWGEGGLLHGAVYDPGVGDFVREAAVHFESAKPAEAFAELAAALVEEAIAAPIPSAGLAVGAKEDWGGGEPPIEGPAGEGLSESEEVRELELRLNERLREPREPPPQWIRPTKWATAGLAIAGAAAGALLHLDAKEKERELDALSQRGGGALRSVEEGRVARSRSAEVRSQSGLGTGLLIGAGVSGLASGILFLLDGGGEGGAREAVRD